jgi:hypothetical protein
MTAEDNVDELIAQFDLAQGEFVKSNPEPIKKCYSHRQEVTLANPIGPTARGWEQVAATLERAASQLRDGELLEVENLAKYVTPELAYVVKVERSTSRLADRRPSPPLVCGQR